MTAFRTIGINCDPIGMSVVYILPGGMGIGPEHDLHVQFFTTRHQITECVLITQKIASMVQGYVRWIKSDDPARAQQGTIRMNPFEIVEPEIGIIMAGVTLYKSQLYPAHWAIEPIGIRRVCEPGKRSLSGQRNGPA